MSDKYSNYKLREEISMRFFAGFNIRMKLFEN